MSDRAQREEDEVGVRRGADDMHAVPAAVLACRRALPFLLSPCQAAPRRRHAAAGLLSAPAHTRCRVHDARQRHILRVALRRCRHALRRTRIRNAARCAARAAVPPFNGDMPQRKRHLRFARRRYGVRAAYTCGEMTMPTRDTPPPAQASGAAEERAGGTRDPSFQAQHALAAAAARYGPMPATLIFRRFATSFSLTLFSLPCRLRCRLLFAAALPPLCRCRHLFCRYLMAISRC